MTLKTPEQCWQELHKEIEAITDLYQLFLTINGAVHESKRAALLVEKYRPQLEQSDCDPLFLETVADRAGAFDYSVARLNTYIRQGETDQELYNQLKKDSYVLCTELLAICKYAFRKDKALQKKLKEIQSGMGDLDLSADLHAYDMFGKTQKPLFEKAKTDMAIFDKALTMHQQLDRLRSKIAVDPKIIEKAEINVMKAWTYVYDAIDEIFEAGRYVFRNQPDIEELFYFDEMQERGKRGGSTTKDTADTASPQTAIHTQTGSSVKQVSES